MTQSTTIVLTGAPRLRRSCGLRFRAGHYSIERASTFWVWTEPPRKVPTDEGFHIRTDQLRGAIDSDRAAGLIPFCVVGVAGTTSTGVIDPLAELAAIARDNSCWFHVDAAYGGVMAFSEKHKGKLQGIQEADSITFDPHKWMFVTFACGAVLVRDVADSASGFESHRVLNETGRSDVEFDFFRMDK